MPKGTALEPSHKGFLHAARVLHQPQQALHACGKPGKSF